ncbi:MAG: YlqD family protein [Candidatus Marinamargulisbacteria bacterium]
MSIQVKRSVHIFVKVDASFKKNYILFISKLIQDLDERLTSYSISMKSKRADKAYEQYVLEKRNDTILQIEQLNQQIEKIKLCPNGDRFKLSTVDGFFPLHEGTPIFSALAPVLVDVEDQTIQKITP